MLCSPTNAFCRSFVFPLVSFLPLFVRRSDSAIENRMLLIDQLRTCLMEAKEWMQWFKNLVPAGYSKQATL